jgi:adenine-specific DNA-methyltransferase
VDTCWRNSSRPTACSVVHHGPIAANAETELLYDQPYEGKNTVRVSGPFTVESLSPHWVLAMGNDVPLPGAEAERRESDDFVRVVLPNLETAGVGNTKKGEQLRFIKGTMRPFSGRHLNAQACCREGGHRGRPGKEGGDIHRAGVRHRQPGHGGRRRTRSLPDV